MKKDDVLLDVGSAEGIFALTHIEKLKHVVLFERDQSLYIGRKTTQRNST